MKFQRRSKLWILVTVLLSAGIIVYDIVKIRTWIFAALGGVFILYSLYQFFSLEKKLDQQLTAPGHDPDRRA
jgi:drug/metabolite transporter superfamily protein YnfA